MLNNDAHRLTKIDLVFVGWNARCRLMNTRSININGYYSLASHIRVFCSCGTKLITKRGTFFRHIFITQ
jgi:hypothetical protein